MIEASARPMSLWRTVLLVLVLTGSAACGQPEQAAGLAPAELEAMRAAASDYATAWLSNDQEAVMGVFVSEPVLSPSGLPFLEGEEAARKFWWPEDGPPMTVTEFTLDAREADGAGDFGFVRGTFSLIFEYDGARTESAGTYLSLMKRTSDGSWRLSHHFWNDLPRAGDS